MIDSSTAATVVTACAAAALSLAALQQRFTAMTTPLDEVEHHLVNDFIAPSARRSEINSYHARHRQYRQRKSWKSFAAYLTERQFRRYFRMSKSVFQDLCNNIVDIVGQDEFKSEEYIDDIMNSRPRVGSANNIFLAHAASTGGFVSGEIKLGLTLRILGGGTYMDMAMIFETSFNHAHKIFKHVVVEWLCHKAFYPINGIQYCSNEEQMRDVALQFASASNGVISGCIGALDGWVVKILKPTRRDNVPDAQSFYSRKGYYGVNVQAIVDKKKKVLFRSILSRGAEHDSTAFKNSTLYKWLLAHWESLATKGYYFIGDSAYSLKSFVLTPYDNTLHGSAEDNFNYFHSSSRIAVECAFGEIDLRWGIFWKPLKFSLRINNKIIDACMRLHNFIIDRRTDAFSEAMDRDIFDDDCRRFFAVNPFVDGMGIHGGEEDVRRDAAGNISLGGRPNRAEANSTEYGRQWRDAHRDDITRQGLCRPRTNWYREDNFMFGQV